MSKEELEQAKPHVNVGAVDRNDDVDTASSPAGDGPFLMPVEDIVSVATRPIIVTGRVERGVIKPGDEIDIVGFEPLSWWRTACVGIESARRMQDQAKAGDYVGIMLRSVKREELQRGQVLAQPGTIRSQTRFVASVSMLSKDEGGRREPFFENYRPTFCFYRDIARVTGAIQFLPGREMVMPGEKDVPLEVTLIAPIALENGQRFEIREGPYPVGFGVIDEVLW